MIVDLTQPKIEIVTEDSTIKSFHYGLAEKCHGYEYLVMSNDKGSSGYPIEPLAQAEYVPGMVFSVVSLWFVDNAFLVDNAGIIWQYQDGFFRRYCRHAAISYVRCHFGEGYQNLVNKVSSEYHEKWLRKMGIHPDCLHDFYNPVYKIRCTTISGCICSCGSVDYGMIADGVTTRKGSSFICKKCNRWEYEVS